MGIVPLENLAVYIHWPYCARICPYCDFNVYKGAQDAALIGAILKDLDDWREQSGPRHIISIHFGGGTPSLMTAHNIRQIITRIETLWGLSGEIEIGLEANPQDQDAEKWAAFKSAGINRLSLGVQSFQDEALKLLGRDHDMQSAKSALLLATNVFQNVSLDLIFGWAGQTPAKLSDDISTALSFNPQHMSAYQLTIESGTAFAKAQARGQDKSVDNDKSAALYDIVETKLIQNGFGHYEVSNYAKPGFESRHNRAYWLGYDYVGVGPGAHGRLTIDNIRRATIAASRPKDYIEQVAKLGSAIIETEALSPEDHASEYVLMGLRINEGISLRRYEQIKGEALKAAHYTSFIEDGFLRLSGDSLIATGSGRLVLDHITSVLLGD